MSVLKGRPDAKVAEVAPDGKPRRRRATLSDGEQVKITTRLTNRQAREMRVSAMEQGITIEEAYSEAVDAYLKCR